MIYVTVGTHTLPFDRLIRAADAFAASTEEEVVIQRGVSRVRTIAARSFDFCDSDEMKRLLNRSRVIVSHGADTILDAVRAGKPVVAVPRMKRYGEHLNDHQVDFTRALAERRWVCALDITDDGLADSIERATTLRRHPVPPVPRPASVIRALLIEWFPEDHATRL